MNGLPSYFLPRLKSYRAFFRRNKLIEKTEDPDHRPREEMIEFMDDFGGNAQDREDFFMSNGRYYIPDRFIRADGDHRGGGHGRKELELFPIISLEKGVDK